MLQYLLTLTDEKNYEKATELYETYKDYMLKYSCIKFCNKNRHNPDLDAFDAVQAAFARIIKYFDRIDFSRSENDIKNYIFSVLNNANGRPIPAI